MSRFQAISTHHLGGSAVPIPQLLAQHLSRDWHVCMGQHDCLGLMPDMPGILRIYACQERSSRSEQRQLI